MSTRLSRAATLTFAAFLGGAILLGASSCGDGGKSGEVLDEALMSKRAAETLPAAEEDYFRDMDGGVSLDARRKSRDATPGSSGPAATIASGTASSSPRFGALDFLKTISSHPELKASRDNRWEYLGLVNEPCFDKPTGPDPKRLRALARSSAAPTARPIRSKNEQKYPGRRRSARAARRMPVGSYYGYADRHRRPAAVPQSRLRRARRARTGTPKRYYNDPAYYNSERRWSGRIASACRAASAMSARTRRSRRPTPRTRSGRTSARTSARSTSGSTASSTGDADPPTFVFQLFHTSRPGSLDTSLVSTDNINNPRTMNAVYNLGAAARAGEALGQGDARRRRLEQQAVQRFRAATDPLAQFFEAPDTVWTPRVLKDGSDSVGALGALNRVYINIGLFSEEWLLHFNALVGGKRDLADRDRGRAEELGLLAGHRAADAGHGAVLPQDAPQPHQLQGRAGRRAAYLTDDAAALTRGKVVFAETLRPLPFEQAAAPPVRPRPRRGLRTGTRTISQCWNSYWAWTQDRRVQDADARRSCWPTISSTTTSSRPSCACRSRCCRPTPAVRWRPTRSRGNIWDNFSSESYKDLPSVGDDHASDHPVTGDAGADVPDCRPAAAATRGRLARQRLVHRSVPAEQHGRRVSNASPSVEARMRSFQDSIEKMLWPENGAIATRCSPRRGWRAPTRSSRSTESSIGRRRGATSTFRPASCRRSCGTC